MELFVSLPYDLCRTYKCSQIFSLVHIACKSTIFAKRNQMCTVTMHTNRRLLLPE